MIKMTCLSAATFAALAVPAFAQDPSTGSATGSCGQPSALSQALGVTVAPGFADLSMVLRPARAEPTYLEFEVTESTEITFETMARDNDAVLTLYGTDGRVVAWDDDSAGNLDARLATTLPPGRYCTQLRLLSAAPIASPLAVLLAYEGLPPDPAVAANEAVAAICADPARSPVLADGLAAGGTPEADGTIDVTSGLAAYRLSLAEAATLQIDAASQTFDTILSVHDMGGGLLWENDDHADTQGSDSRIREAFEPGEYCVVVKPFSGTGGSFSLTVDAEGAAQPK